MSKISCFSTELSAVIIHLESSICIRAAEILLFQYYSIKIRNLTTKLFIIHFYSKYW